MVDSDEQQTNSAGGTDAGGRRALDQLRESERRYRFIADNAVDVIWTMDLQGRFTFVTPSVEELQGYCPAAFLRLAVDEVMPGESVQKMRQAMQERMAHSAPGVATLELEARHRNGETIPVEVRARFIRDESGRPTGVIGVTRDITERRQLQARLAQADRLASVGSLAAGLAHEINNPLTYVLSNLQSLAEDLPRLAETVARLRCAVAPLTVGQVLGDATETASATWLDDLVQRAEEAVQGAGRVRDIVRDLKTFSRADDEQTAPVSVNQVIDSSASIALSEIKHRARLVKDYGELPPVIANDGKLAQVFLNLLLNAARAIEAGDPDRHEIRVTTRSDGGQVVVEVSDTGPVLAPDARQRVFDPFHSNSASSGLDLCICHTIVTGMGGTIAVHSEPGRGTRFEIRLPAAPGATAKASAAAPALLAPAVERRALIVDDEPLVARAIARALAERAAVAPVVATSGASARAEIDADPRFDLIICSAMLPDVSGMDLHRWLAADHPQLAARIAFITGDACAQQAAALLETVRKPLLEKPFDPRTLGDWLQQVIGE